MHDLRKCKQRRLVLVGVLFGSSPEYLLLNYPTPHPLQLDPWVKKKNKQKNFYGRSVVSPTCFVFVSHMLPFLWQMELSKEVKDDAVQLCGSGVMRPGASAAWQQEPGDRTCRTEQKTPSRLTTTSAAETQSMSWCTATFSLWQNDEILFLQCVVINGFHISLCDRTSMLPCTDWLLARALTPLSSLLVL